MATRRVASSHLRTKTNAAALEADYTQRVTGSAAYRALMGVGDPYALGPPNKQPYLTFDAIKLRIAVHAGLERRGRWREVIEACLAEQVAPLLEGLGVLAALAQRWDIEGRRCCPWCLNGRAVYHTGPDTSLALRCDYCARDYWATHPHTGHLPVQPYAIALFPRMRGGRWFIPLKAGKDPPTGADATVTRFAPGTFAPYSHEFFCGACGAISAARHFPGVKTRPHPHATLLRSLGETPPPPETWRSMTVECGTCATRHTYGGPQAGGTL